MQSNIRLSDILERPDLDNDERQKLYNASMERYLELRQQKDSQVPTVRFVPVKEEEKKQHERQLSEVTVVGHILKTMHPRATALLNRLKSRPDVITWDKTGQVKIEGKTIENSNTSDLVGDAMRARKNFNPMGSKEFFQALSRLNVPKDLVRNQERWRQLDDTPKSTDHYPALRLLSAYKEKKTPKRWLEY